MSELKQAMLLAAGLSTRMRPLTNDIPKPLVPFLDHRILDYTLMYLKKQKIQEVCTNVFHGKKKYLQELKKAVQGYRIRAFEEKPEILGTGGGIKNMRSFVMDDHFAVVNCDFFTDVDLHAAFAYHLKKKAVATMVLIESEDAKKYGEIGINEAGHIVQFPYGHPPGGAIKVGMFSGIHIFHTDIFAEMPADQAVFDINKDVYAKILDKGGPVLGHLVKARWIDVGEIALYEAAQKELREHPMSWMR
jgi:mannose-1-phosphate guanylyltransferase